MFEKILIANRGEIALRILRACRTLGIEAVVAYSDADRETLAVRQADEAICIGPADARRSYLSAPAIISAAIVTGCEAVHPGYGFLSEDEDFAEAVRAHGLTFVGPSPEVLDRFASKAGTRQLLGAYGLPTIPGSDGMLRADLHAPPEAGETADPGPPLTSLLYFAVLAHAGHDAAGRAPSPPARAAARRARHASTRRTGRLRVNAPQLCATSPTGGRGSAARRRSSVQIESRPAPSRRRRGRTPARRVRAADLLPVRPAWHQARPHRPHRHLRDRPAAEPRLR